MNKVIDKSFRSCRFVSTIVKHPVLVAVFRLLLICCRNSCSKSAKKKNRPSCCSKTKSRRTSGSSETFRRGGSKFRKSELWDGTTRKAGKEFTCFLFTSSESTLTSVNIRSFLSSGESVPSLLFSEFKNGLLDVLTTLWCLWTCWFGDFQMIIDNSVRKNDNINITFQSLCHKYGGPFFHLFIEWEFRCG